MPVEGKNARVLKIGLIVAVTVLLSVLFIQILPNMEMKVRFSLLNNNACIFSFIYDVLFSIVSGARSGLTIQTSFSIEWLIIHLMTITHRASSWSNHSVRTCTHGFQRMLAMLQLFTARLAKAAQVSWLAVTCYTVTSSRQPKMLSISMVRNEPLI